MSWTSPRESRETAILEELRRAAGEYRKQQNAFEIARQNREAAKERFSAVRRLAQEVLSANAWYQWKTNNDDLLMVGSDIGDAIYTILETHAYTAAEAVLADPPTKSHYWPARTPKEIAEALDDRGFEFRTATPGREVHAALLHLKRVTKSGDKGSGERFAVEHADEIFQSMKDVYEEAARKKNT